MAAWFGTALTAIAAAIVMFGVLVVVHEFGHFIVAKWFRIGVPVFSIGFGPRLWGFEYKGTEYRVSALPIGGYVQMAGADPFGEEDADSFVDPDEDFMKKPVWQRLLVMVAGPLFNLILPFVLFTSMLMLGEPQMDRVVGSVMPDTPASEAGFEVGDVIVAVEDAPVGVWLDFEAQLERRAERDEIPVTVLRDGQEHVLTLGPEAVRFAFDGALDMEQTGVWALRRSSRVGVDDPDSPAGRAGLKTGDQIVAVDGEPVEDWNGLLAVLGSDRAHEVRYRRAGPEGTVVREATLSPDPDWRPDDPVVGPFGLLHSELFVGNLGTDSPAMKAGLQPNDRMVSVDGRPIRAWSDVLRYVGDSVPDGGSEARPLELVVVRDGERRTFELVPAIEREVVRGEPRWRPIMGVRQYPDAYMAGPTVKVYYSIFQAVPRAVDQGTEVFLHTLRVLGNVVTRDLQFSESVGGPIEIFRIATQSAQRGIFYYVRTIGIISFSLGIINLLPVPVLDGGQILFYSIEGIRGRPLSLEIRERVQMVGVLALVALLLVASVNDVNRAITAWFGG